MRRDRIRAEAEHHETVRQMKKDFRLEQLGEYRLTAIFTNDLSGMDSLERVFTLTGEEYKVETIVHFQRESKSWYHLNCTDSINSGHFTIIKYSKPSPQVKIEYLRYCNGEIGEISGPIFTVKNESRDTLYGEWLPGYLWGTLSKWVDGEYVGNKCGVLDTNCVEAPPLYPNSDKLAWVGSFGIKISSGKYRFNLYYSTGEEINGSSKLTSETDTFRWWSAVKNRHLLTCEFEKE